MPLKLAPPAVVLLAALVLGGCGKKPAAPTTPAPIEVGVVTLATQPVNLTRELPGRTSAYRVAEVRARVSGIVLKRLFTEGSDVTESQPLYRIDPAPYQAALDSSKANLARAEASAASSRLQEERFRQLLAEKAISQQDYDNALAAAQAGQADVAAGNAAVQTAAINLGYTNVTSPISGRIGLSQITEGAYVQAGTATLLATVQQLDPLYVNLTQSSTEAFNLRRALATGRLEASPADAAKVNLILDDGSTYPEEGTLEFSGITVDPTSNSITLRALFPNPKSELFPGLFVRARIAEGTVPAALLIPQLGVGRNTRGDATALVVGAGNQAELRILKIDRAVGNQWLVAEGLKAGDRLIVQNLQRIRPGSVVKAVPATNLPAR